MWVLILFACGGTSGVSDRGGNAPVEAQDDEQDALVGHEPPPVPPGATPVVPEVPLLSDALKVRCPNVVPRADAPEGDDLFRVALTGAHGVCNDGSTPVMYVRAASDPLHQNDWTLHLDGGGACQDHEGCAQRWCGETFYKTAKMTAIDAPASIRASGIQSDNAANAFAAWNHVLGYYCSSDGWTGQARDVVMDGDPHFRLHFTGADLVDDMLDALDKGVEANGVLLPSIGQAQRVVFSGSSAAAVGLMMHVDRVAERLAPARVVGVVDSMLEMAPEVLSERQARALYTYAAQLWEQVYLPIWDGVVDTSCQQSTVEPHADCGHFDILLRQHVATPLVIHHDVSDLVLFDRFARSGMTKQEYRRAGLDTFALWAQTENASVHVSDCGEHTWVDDTRDFLEGSVTDFFDPSIRWTLHDVVDETLRGGRAVAIDESRGRGSVCR